jgi:hypothetical protein
MGKKPINILLIKTINTATYSFVSLIHIKLKVVLPKTYSNVFSITYFYI